MTQRKNIHAYTKWAKNHLDEMDAAIFVLEDKIENVEKAAYIKAQGAIDDMRAWRNSFKARIDENIDKSKEIWDDAKIHLENDWEKFEEAVQLRMETVKDYVPHIEATFQARADAQINGWKSAIDELENEAIKIKIDSRVEVEKALARMKDKATDVEVKLDRLKKAETKTAAAIDTALSESRVAFEKANKEAHKAFKKALD